MLQSFVSPRSQGRDTSLRRALDVLFTISHAHEQGKPGLSVTKVAELMQLDKSQASRTLKVLLEYGMVDRDPETRLYRTGWRLFDLAKTAGDQRLITVSEPVLDSIVADVNESVYVATLSGIYAVTVAERNPSHAVIAGKQTWTVEATAVGRTLLFDLSDGDIMKMLADHPLNQVTKAAPRTLRDVCKRVAKARNDGYAVVIDEYEVGLTAVGAPIHDHRGRVIASLGISGPTFRLSGRTDSLIDSVRKGALEIERQLG